MLSFGSLHPNIAARTNVPVMGQPQYVTEAQDKLLKREAPWKPGEVMPDHLDGSRPGDLGFDPLFLTALARKPVVEQIGVAIASTDQREVIMQQMSAEEITASIEWMRESEIKHARLAMLAAVGWPMAELLNPWSLEVTDGRAPSLFNGGLGDGPITPFLVLAAGFAAYLEFGSVDSVNRTWLKEPAEYVPGDLGFDPLGVMDGEGAFFKAKMHKSEIFNGRLAMMAITGMAVQEFFWARPVVEQTPFFFGR